MSLLALLRSWLAPPVLRRSPVSRRKSVPFRRTGRPVLEALEARLPPGDVLGGPTLSPWSWLPAGSAARPAHVDTISLFDSGRQNARPGSVLDLHDTTWAGFLAQVRTRPQLLDAAPPIARSESADPKPKASSDGDPFALGDVPERKRLVEPSTLLAPTPIFPLQAGGFGRTEAGSPATGVSISPNGSASSAQDDVFTAQVLFATPAAAVSASAGAESGTRGVRNDDPPGPSASVTVTLEAPAFTGSPNPELVLRVRIDESAPPKGPVQAAHIDIDLNQNGAFDDPGELAYETVTVPGYDQPIGVALSRPLAEGTYEVRGRAVDLSGGEWLSATATMQVDPSAGYLGSDALRRLYADYVVATTGEPDPVWSSVYWGGGGPAHFALKQRVTSPPTAFLTMEQFRARLHQRFVTDAEERVLVNVRTTLPTHLPGLQADLEALGMAVVTLAPEQNLVIGYLPIPALPAVLGLANYASMTPGYPRARRLGSVTSEGDRTMLADTFRTATGSSGGGVAVGVISDSASQVGGGIAASQSTGDLTGSVLVLADGTDPLDVDEGRAMMEIVQDVAPGSRLFFHTSGGSPQVMASGVDVLGNLGARVIVDDIFFLNMPMFNDGVVNRAIERQAAQNNVVYVAAAGNDADDAYDSVWRPRTQTFFGVPFFAHDLGGGDVLQNFTLNVGQSLLLAFQWDDAFLEGGSSQSNYQVTTDLDLYITNGAGTQLFDAFIDFNDVTDESIELVTFTNTGGFGTNQFAFLFDHFAGPVPSRIRWIAFTSLGSADPLAQGQGGPTVFGTPVARSAIAVGAVNWATPTVPEPITSLGGSLPIYFDINGNRLATPEVRFKPDLTGTDMVRTSFFPAPAPGNIFDGTSAAAPHVAGAVALLIDECSSAGPNEVLPHLRATARDIAAPGLDPLTGSGLVQLRPGISCPPPPVTADAFEPNDSSDQARDFGFLAGMQSYTDLSIADHPDGLPDYDWFRWTAGDSGTFTVTIDIRPGSGDLELHLFTLDGPTLTELGSSISPGAFTRTLTTTVTTGQVILVEVKGRNSALGVLDQGFYELTVDLS